MWSMDKVNSPRRLSFPVVLLVVLAYFVLLVPKSEAQNRFSSARTFGSLNEISFRAYTDPKNPDKFKVIETGNTKSLQSSGLRLQPGDNVTIIAHVFLEDILISNSPSQRLKNAFLAAGHKNVIIAHWHRKSDRPITQPQALILYQSVVFNDAPKVGRLLAEFIAFLVNAQQVRKGKGKTGTGAEGIHVIGLSLGAHIAASAGNHLQKSFSLKLGRITGLDPPGALFTFISKDEKLDPNDATFVDVLHTDTVFLGTRDSLGHVDFYSNGGKREDQPDCGPGTIFPSLTDQIFCGHTTSVTIYIDSLSRSFNACRCLEKENLYGLRFSPCIKPQPGQCVLSTAFGESGLNKAARGNYYLKT